MRSRVYSQPLYYDIAFSFVNPKKQVDNFEKFIRKFSKIKPKRFLDIACGPSLQLIELAKRGYKTAGLDISKEMLDYLKYKAKQQNVKINTICADLQGFHLKKKADFAFIMMGSLDVESEKNLMDHLDSVSSSLNKGGLYLIQNIMVKPPGKNKQSWTMKRDGINVKTIYDSSFVNRKKQIFKEKIILEVNDNGKKKKFVHEKNLKFIPPRKLKKLIELNGKFEFVGWWVGTCNEWFLDKPLEKAKNKADNIVLLRKKQ
ncbi:MAG: class I SAM-dependent methyltransferase [Candidatus Aenigmatarchaeota archaeon]